MNTLAGVSTRVALLALIAGPSAYSHDFTVRLENCSEFIGVTSVSQIGVVLVPPDGSGDINNYTLSYTTNSLRLAVKLELAGLPVTLDPDLVYEITPDPPGAAGELFSEVSPLASPSWFLSGVMGDPTPGPTFPFVANWWYKARQGRLKMSSSIPLLNYGLGSVKAHWGNSSSFGTNLRGVFANGTMTVSTP
jgi:hypothetical protein